MKNSKLVDPAFFDLAGASAYTGRGLAMDKALADLEAAL